MNQVLGSLGIVSTTPISQTRLITPYADGIKAFSAFLKSAEKKMRTMIYGATLQEYFDDILALKEKGLDIKVIFDHTQSAGHAERPQIDRLIAAGWKDGVDFIIGTSPKAGQIIHIKATWIDDRFVEDGSLNYSPSAFKQINTISFSEHPEWVAYLNGIFEEAWTWIVAHDPQYNIVG